MGKEVRSLWIAVLWAVAVVGLLSGFLWDRHRTASVGIVFEAYDASRRAWRIGEVWSGSPADRAGLVPGDHVLSVDGMHPPEEAYADLDDLPTWRQVQAWRSWHGLVAARIRPGRPVELEILRRDRGVERVRLVTEPTPVQEFFRYGLWSLLVAGVFFGLAWMLASRRRDPAVTAQLRFGALFASFLVVQSVRSFPSTLVGDHVNMALSYGVGDVLFFASGAALLDFVGCFLGWRRQALLRAASYVAMLALAAAYVTRLLYRGAFVGLAGMYVASYVALLAAFMAEKQVLRRKQLKWLLWGGGVPIAAFVISYLLWASPFLSLSLRQTKDVQTLASLAFPMAVAMAVQEDRLFDVDLTVRRSVLGAAILPLAIMAYSKLVELLGGAVAGWASPSFLLVVVLVVVLMLPGQIRAEELLDRLVGRNRHARRIEVQRQLAKLADMEEFEAMGRHVAGVLMDVLDMRGVAVYVPTDKPDVFDPVVVGDWEVPPRRLSQADMARLPPRPVFAERLEELPEALGRPTPDYLAPLTAAARKVGLLVLLGREGRFGGFGTTWDRDVLDMVDMAAATAAAAVDRLLYRRLLERLQQMQAQVIHTGRLSAIGTLAAGLAHELNTPLGYIKANAQLLQRKLEPYREELETALGLAEDILQGAEQMHEVVKGLRQFAQIDRPDLAETDLNTCVEDSLKMLDRMGSWKVQVRKQLEPVPKILAKPAQINQMVVNLVANACDASPEGSTVWVRTFVEDEWVVLEVEDEGSGVPPDVLERIFDPFFTTKSAKKGMGLGLSITRTIVENHGGRIRLANKPDRGVIARVWLPIRRVDHGKEAEQ